MDRVEGRILDGVEYDIVKVLTGDRVRLDIKTSTHRYLGFSLRALNTLGMKVFRVGNEDNKIIVVKD